MKKEKYPLAELVQIKQKRLEEAEKILKEKRQALAREEEKMVKVQAERDKVKGHQEAKLTQLREEMDKGSPSLKIQQMKQYLKLVMENLKTQDAKVKEQKKQVEAAIQQVEAARREYLQRQTDIEKLGIHHKEWDKEISAEILRKETIEEDELGSAQHERLKRKKHKEK